VMVDGAPRRGSVVTLSHWPQAATPREVARDLSVEMALDYARVALGLGLGLGVAGSERETALRALVENGGRAVAVTNDHFDEDGLVSVLALVDPEWSLARERLLVGVASCGDFGVVPADVGDVAARIAFAIEPLADEEAGGGAGTSQRYLAVLPVVRALVDRPEQYEALWHEEMGVYEAGRRAVGRGDVSIVEEPELDLAIVQRSVGASPAGAAGGLPVHAAVVHSRTSCSRVLAFDGPRCELYLRYESWVRYCTRKVPLRPELAPLAAELTALEPGLVTWETHGVGAIVCRLRPVGEGESELAPEVVTDRVRAYLRRAAAAWDPWRDAGPYIGPPG
jgi:hypothetical protein